MLSKKNTILALAHRAESIFKTEPMDDSSAKREIIWFLKDIIILLDAEMQVHRPETYERILTELELNLYKQLARVRESNNNS